MNQACADKLRMEMEDFGYPPVFPEETTIIQPSEPDELVIKDKSKGKKVYCCWLSFVHCSK